MVGLLSGGDLPLPGEPPSERSVRESRGAAEVFGALLSALASFSAAAGAVPTVHSLLRAAPSDWAPHMQLRNDVADALPEELLTEEVTRRSAIDSLGGNYLKKKSRPQIILKKRFETHFFRTTLLIGILVTSFCFDYFCYSMLVW
jgi:hypothetical protein